MRGIADEVQDPTERERFYISFIASNGQVLGYTENYKQKASAQHCANLLKEQAGGATIEDLT